MRIYAQAVYETFSDNALRFLVPTFIASQELTKLAKRLRMYGYDTLIYTSIGRGPFIVQALGQNRIMLTRKRLIPQGLEHMTLVIQHETLSQQLAEVFFRFKLTPKPQDIGTRCTICNERLEKVDKLDHKELIPARAFDNYCCFAKCARCNKIYWPGTHVQRIMAALHIYRDDR